MSWHAQILTLFPEMFPGPLGQSIAGRALADGLWQLSVHNIRDSAIDKHQTADDSPFGGGAGMVLKPDVIDRAIAALPSPGRLIYLSPRGTVLNQAQVENLRDSPVVTLLCGRYEGVDQRVLDAWGAEELSIGDYVLSGGELAAMVVCEAVTRLIPGVMGNDATAGEESFVHGLLEYPHYTRPAIWHDRQGVERAVPDVLLSGHHARIADWRRLQAEQVTQLRRPDLWQTYAAHKAAEEAARQTRKKRRNPPGAMPPAQQD